MLPGHVAPCVSISYLALANCMCKVHRVYSGAGAVIRCVVREAAHHEFAQQHCPASQRSPAWQETNYSPCRNLWCLLVLLRLRLLLLLSPCDCRIGILSMLNEQPWRGCWKTGVHSPRTSPEVLMSCHGRRQLHYVASHYTLHSKSGYPLRSTESS